MHAKGKDGGGRDGGLLSDGGFGDGARHQLQQGFEEGVPRGDEAGATPQRADSAGLRSDEPAVLLGEGAEEVAKLLQRQSFRLEHYEGPLPHPDILHQYDEEERALILDAYRAATVGESARLDRIVEGDISASKSAGRREAFKIMCSTATNLAVMGLSIWAFVATGNPLSLALPAASVIGSIVVTVRAGRKDEGAHDEKGRP